MTHFYDRINTIYEFIKSVLDKKNVFFKDYGAFKKSRDVYKIKHYESTPIQM